MARKNEGSETPPMAKTRVTWSIQRPFMCAVSAPSETPTTIEMSSENAMSWSEYGRKRRMSSSTGRRVRIDSPQSPCTRSRT